MVYNGDDWKEGHDELEMKRSDYAWELRNIAENVICAYLNSPRPSPNFETILERAQTVASRLMSWSHEKASKDITE